MELYNLNERMIWGTEEYVTAAANRQTSFLNMIFAEVCLQLMMSNLESYVHGSFSFVSSLNRPLSLFCY